MRWKQYLLFVIGIIFVLIVVAPVFPQFDNIGKWDWDQFCFFDEAPRKTILEYSQFPVWNPYASGGRPLLANPQYGFLKPTFVFTLMFGCVIGLKLEMILLLIAGVIGMLLLARQYKLSVFAGLLAATLFGLSSYFSLRMIEGHITFLPFVLVPYAFLFYLKSLENRHNVIFAAIFFALMILGGGVVHVFLPLTLFLGIYSIVLAAQKKNMRPVILFVAVIIVALGFSAIKTLPMLSYLSDAPRATETSNELTALPGLLHVFLNSNPELAIRHFAEQKWRWHEYSAYTSLLPLLLFVLGVFLFWRKQLPLIVAGAAMLAISLGAFAKWAPWNLLHSLPFIESMHVPSRFVILFIFSLAIISSLSVDALFQKTDRNKILKVILIIILTITIIDLLLVGNNAFRSAFPNDKISVTPNNMFAQIVDDVSDRSGAASSMYWNLLENKGTLNAYDPVPHTVFAKSSGDDYYCGEVCLEGNGKASYKYWSPNKLVININANESALLVVNQNYDQGWHVVDGRAKKQYNGLLATQVMPSDREITFVYINTWFFSGIAISALFILGAAYFIKKKHIVRKLGRK